MYDTVILVYKNVLDDVKGQSYLDSGCEITFGISETPAQRASLITKMYKCVVLLVGPINELNGSKAPWVCLWFLIIWRKAPLQTRATNHPHWKPLGLHLESATEKHPRMRNW